MDSLSGNDQPLIPIREVADELGVSISTLRRWDREGILRPIRLTPGSPRRYRRSDVDALAAQASA